MKGRVSALAIDPTNANVIFAGTAGGGVWNSGDAGITWAMTDSQPSLCNESNATTFMSYSGQ